MRASNREVLEAVMQPPELDETKKSPVKLSQFSGMAFYRGILVLLLPLGGSASLPGQEATV